MPGVAAGQDPLCHIQGRWLVKGPAVGLPLDSALSVDLGDFSFEVDLAALPSGAGERALVRRHHAGGGMQQASPSPTRWKVSRDMDAVTQETTPRRNVRKTAERPCARREAGAAQEADAAAIAAARVAVTAAAARAVDDAVATGVARARDQARGRPQARPT